MAVYELAHTLSTKIAQVVMERSKRQVSSNPSNVVYRLFTRIGHGYECAVTFQDWENRGIDNPSPRSCLEIKVQDGGEGYYARGYGLTGEVDLLQMNTKRLMGIPLSRVYLKKNDMGEAIENIQHAYELILQDICDVLEQEEKPLYKQHSSLK